MITRNDSQLTLPNLTEIRGDVRTHNNSQLTLLNLTSIDGSVETYESPQLTLPNLIRIGGHVVTYGDTQLTLPNLTSVKDSVVTYGDSKLTLSNITNIGGYVDTFGNSQLTLPSSMQGKYEGNITWVDNTRFSVSRDNNLIAVHNLSEYNMRRVIDMGALVMPSIAITNTKIEYTSFGDISLLFGKDTIDPSDRRNKVYGGDAWTPRFPHLEPKINESVAKDFRKKMYDLFSDTRLRDLYHISSEVHESNISDNIRNGGVERYYNKEFMKHAYLLDKGKKVKVPMTHKDYGKYSDAIIDLAKTKGLSLSEIYSDTSGVYRDNKDLINELHERIIDIDVSSLSTSEEMKEKVRGMLRKDEMSFSKFDDIVVDAFYKERDLKYGSVEIVDERALLDDVNSRVNSNNANYRKWVNDLFDGIIEKYGIRNNKDWYTPSGEQRSWNALYDNVTPSNILKHMLSKSQQGGQGLFNSSIFGASAEEYGSIEEIRERGKERLQKEDEEVYEEWSNSVFNRLSDIGNEVMSRNSSLYDIDNFNQRIIDAVSKKKIASGIYKEVKRFYPKFTMSHAKQVEDIVKEIQAHAIGYFEAKPQRIISLNEVVKAVVPTGTSADVIDGLKGYGIEVVTYRRGNDNAHKRAIERASKDIRFSFIGEKGTSNLDKAEEATIRLDNLAVAREMEEVKKDAKTIKLATGWERGADGMWRYEVEDNFDLTELENRLQENLDDGLSKTWGIVYPSDLGDLTKAYPDFNVDIMVWVGDEFENTGEYSPATEGDETTFGKPASIEVKAKTVADIKGVLVHEIQHAIQEKEGFAEGGSVFGLKDKLSSELDKRTARLKELRAEGRDAEADELTRMTKGLAEAVINNAEDTYQNYRKLAGEVEARNATKRMDMLAEQKLNTLLEATEDVSRKDQIFLYDGLGSEMRFSKKFNRDNIAEVVYRNRMIIDYNRYVFENRPKGILKPHYGYIDEDRLEEYKAFYQDIKNKAEDLKSYLKKVIMTDATSGAKSFLNEYIAKIDREVDAYRRLSENDNSVFNEYLRFSKNNANQEIFVSNAQRAVEGIKQDKATPEQWLKMIEKQGGLKAGEDKWLGLSDWLKASDKKSITKQEILDFIGENKIEIEEERYGDFDVTSLDEEVADYEQRLTEMAVESPIYDEINDEFQRRFDAMYDIEQDKADEYEERTGDYIEVDKYAIANRLFEEMVAERGSAFRDAFKVWDEDIVLVPREPRRFAEYLDFHISLPSGMPINSTRLNYTTQGLENKREIALTVPTIESWNESDDIHFGDAGGGRAVAWIRFGETTDSDGNSVLVIDEIQSKRHQEGREKGYKSDYKNSKAAVKIQNEIDEKTARLRELAKDKQDNSENELVRLAQIDIAMYEVKRTSEYDELLAEENEIKTRMENRESELFTLRRQISDLKYQLDRQINSDYMNSRNVVPDAPFEKNWHELAMKRMLRLAAEEGYDKVAWTKGEQQAERYDIGNVVNGIDANPPDADFEYTQVLVYNDGATLEMDVDKDGIIVKGYESASQEYEGKNLSEVVGKENAIKLLTGEEVKLRGENFRLGGEGMKGFYDEMLPRFMNRYGKKWGTKVEDVKLPNVEKAGRVMHSVAVTEEMRESVMEGQVMFSKKRTAPETVSVHDEHLQTVVSSAVGAKVLNNIDDAIKEYGNHTLTKEKTFLGNLAKILNAKRDGSNSEYATFEAVNGKVFTIRLSDHNATVSNFDVRDEDRGISIVITAKDNKGITNDGDAHVTEYFYDAIKLRKADGKPLVEILKSVKQALYSGEYKDNTGLAEVREVNNTNGIDDTRFSRKMGEAKAQLADMKYGETVRMDALAQAKTMLLQGEPMEDIFAQTGWKQQNMFGKPTWIYTEPELSAREKLDRFLKADRKSEIEMLTLGNKKLSELRAMLGDTINMKTFKSKLKEIGKSEKEVREDLADFVL